MLHIYYIKTYISQNVLNLFICLFFKLRVMEQDDIKDYGHILFSIFTLH